MVGNPEVMRLSIAVPGERLVDFQLDRNTVAFVYNGTDRIERELRSRHVPHGRDISIPGCPSRSRVES